MTQYHPALLLHRRVRVQFDHKRIFTFFESGFNVVRSKASNRISREELERLYDEHACTLYGVATTILRDNAAADETLKQTFLYIQENYADFDEARQTCFMWMVNNCRRIALEKVKRSSSTQNQHTSGEFSTAMTPEQKQVLDQVFFGGAGVSEVSKQLSLNETRVKQLLREAVSQYRSVIQEDQWK